MAKKKPKKAQKAAEEAVRRTKAKPAKSKPAKSKPTKAKPTKTKPSKAKAKPVKAKPTKAKPSKAKAKPVKAKPVKPVKPTKARPVKAKPSKPLKPAKAKAKTPLLEAPGLSLPRATATAGFQVALFTKNGLPARSLRETRSIQITTPEGKTLSRETLPELFQTNEEKSDYLNGRLRAILTQAAKKKAQKSRAKEERRLQILVQRGIELDQEIHRLESRASFAPLWSKRDRYLKQAEGVRQELADLEVQIDRSLKRLFDQTAPTSRITTQKKRLLSYQIYRRPGYPRQEIQVEFNALSFQPVEVTHETLKRVLISLRPLAERLWKQAEKRSRRRNQGEIQEVIFRFLYSQQAAGRTIEQGYGLERFQYDKFEFAWDTLIGKLESRTSKGFLSPDEKMNYFLSGKVPPRIHLTGFTVEFEMERGPVLKGDELAEKSRRFSEWLLPQRVKGLQTSLLLLKERAQRMEIDPELIVRKEERLRKAIERLKAQMKKIQRRPGK